MTPETFKRTVRNFEAVYRRLDRGELTGRNADATEATLEGHYRALKSALDAELYVDDSPLFALLESDERLAARWNRLERRRVGLPV
jgi:hypothetical protein